MKKSLRICGSITLCVMALHLLSFSQSAKDYVDETVYKYVSDGCWCWFQDERAVIDTVKNKLVIGSTNMQSSCDVTIFNLQTKKVESSKRFGKLEYSDDHNAPGICIAPNGNYVAIWAHHYDKYNSRYSIYNGSGWSAEKKYDWTKIPGGTDYTIAYSNVYYLANEKRMLNFARANDRAPNFLFSDDNGETWEFGGQLTTNSSSSYNKGYYKYWGNGVDRIDMVFTEQHPRDFTTSIYHGYITDGKTYNTEGKLADDNIYDLSKIPTFDKFTKVFVHGTKVNGVTMGRCWQHDIARYDDGTIVILFKARANDAIDDHRNFYARYDGTKWSITYLGKAGKHIYGNEHDYVGLGSVNPDDPDRIYMCTAFNPGNDNEAPSSKREIWRGTTKDKGMTWKWEPVTANSSVDNFRPVVPKWKTGKEAVLWFRGVYTSAQNVKSEVVGTFYDYDLPVHTTNLKPATESTLSFEALNRLTCSNTISLQYTVRAPAQVSIEVFSASGRKMTTLVNNRLPKGRHTADWNTAVVPTGIYIASMSINGQYFVKQLIVRH